MGYFLLIPRYLRESITNATTILDYLKCGMHGRVVFMYGAISAQFVLLGILFVGLNVGFCFAEINDLDYQSRFYIISKRLLKVAVGTCRFYYLLL